MDVYLDNSATTRCDGRVAQKVLEHGAPIPWKQIVAELGHRWTVGKARYAYARVCALCFAGEET